MADETRMRGLDERCTALYKALQEETLRRVVTEQNFQDQLHSTNTEMMGKMEALSGKQDQLSHTLEGFQTMFHQIFDRLDLIYQNEASVLGKPPSNTYYEESSSTKSPMVPDLQTRNQQEVRTSLGEPHHHLIPQDMAMPIFSSIDELFADYIGKKARVLFAPAAPSNKEQVPAVSKIDDLEKSKGVNSGSKREDRRRIRAPRFALELDGVHCFETILPY